MSLPPLVPGVKRSTWRLHDAKREEADDAYAQVRAEVLRRDRYTCRFCGFQTTPDRDAGKTTLAASGYLEVHHIDDNHQNNALTNLVTACPFCHQVFHAGNAGNRGCAQVIWFPWLSQADLNLLCNVIGVAMFRNGSYAEDARSLWNALLSCNAPIAQYYGQSMTDAANFGSILMGLHRAGTQYYEKRMQVFDGVRLLPTIRNFEQAIKWWADKAWLPESQWEAVAADVRDAINKHAGS